MLIILKLKKIDKNLFYLIINLIFVKFLKLYFKYLGFFLCILKKVKNIIKLKNLKIFYLKEIVMKNKLIVVNIYLNSILD